jgi:hypothetical protein
MTGTQIKMEDDPQRIPLAGMIRMVAFGIGMRGMEAAVWVEVVFLKLSEAGVHNLRDFVGSILTLEQIQVLGEDAESNRYLLEMMLMETCDLMFGPEEDLLEVDPDDLIEIDPEEDWEEDQQGEPEEDSEEEEEEELHLEIGRGDL